MTVVHINEAGVDREAILRYLNLDPRKPETQAALLVCQRYGLDPLLKHVVLISGNVYVTRDGYLAIAHESGQFDGIEVVETGETETHFTAKVSVYRKDMGRPFTYVGRYPKKQRMANDYGPEMAVKVAEVQALRRAFNVTGVGAVDERWDDEVPTNPQPELEPDPQAVFLKALIDELDDDAKPRFRERLKDIGIRKAWDKWTTVECELVASELEQFRAELDDERPFDEEAGE